jgi:hypothetical protein
VRQGRSSGGPSSRPAAGRGRRAGRRTGSVHPRHPPQADPALPAADQRPSASSGRSSASGPTRGRSGRTRSDWRRCPAGSMPTIDGVPTPGSMGRLRYRSSSTRSTGTTPRAAGVGTPGATPTEVAPGVTVTGRRYCPRRLATARTSSSAASIGVRHCPWSQQSGDASGPRKAESGRPAGCHPPPLAPVLNRARCGRSNALA